jgi:hypothetical protein
MHLALATVSSCISLKYKQVFSLNIESYDANMRYKTPTSEGHRIKTLYKITLAPEPESAALIHAISLPGSIRSKLAQTAPGLTSLHECWIKMALDTTKVTPPTAHISHHSHT